MDFEQIKKQVQNLTLNDLKKGVRSVQNVVMNLTETESKVREATTNDPWAASSNLLREISDVSHYTEDRIQIMNMIDRRFHEKGPQEWRQIYKALQLLDFLIRNGDQEIVNAALDIHRMRMLKIMHKSFQALDHEGKDVGQNVRILSGNIHALLQDTSSIREARREAARNRSKYVGVSSDNFSGSSARFGASSYSSSTGSASFNHRSFGAPALTDQIRGDGGIYGHRPRPTAGLDEYDEADDPVAIAVGRPRRASRARRSSTSRSASATTPAPKPKTASATAAAKPAAPAPAIVDLLDIGFDDSATAASSSSAPPPLSRQPAQSAASAAAADDFDDDFDDFQSAPVGPAGALQANKIVPVAAAPVLMASKPANSSLLTMSAPVTTAATPTATGLASGPNYGASLKPSGGLSALSSNQAGKPRSGPSGDAFSDLLMSAGYKAGTNQTAPVAKGGQASLAAMNKKQLDEKLWGGAAAGSGSGSAATTQKPGAPSESLIDLL